LRIKPPRRQQDPDLGRCGACALGSDPAHTVDRPRLGEETSCAIIDATLRRPFPPQRMVSFAGDLEPTPRGSPPSERWDRALLPLRPIREGSHHEFSSGRTDARGDVVRPHYIRAVMDADVIDPRELAATLRQTGRMLARRTRREGPQSMP